MKNITVIEEKREKEKIMIKKMITFYCKKHKHSDTKDLCSECNDILEYSNLRISKCPFMETKTFCNNCKIHCFKPDMRVRISKVMKYSGQRMILREPIPVIKHLYCSIKEKKLAK